MTRNAKSQSGLMSFEDAFARITHVEPLTATQTVALRKAHGRILAKSVASRLTQPPTDVSAMDGYAVHAADTADGTKNPLTVAHSIVAGDAPGTTIKPGEAARIFTGAPLPSGADAILIQENAHHNDDGTVSVGETVEAGKFVRRAGYDFATGDAVLQSGSLLNATALSLAAAAGHSELTVTRPPRVGILSTGNDLA
ncbi:MAG: hypothetical protein AAFO77_08545 [Pseudomonadota bacterium]